eukprot:m.148933 g.148933  ORF g.148933 m.148933 type:complete len:692 (-) comp14194_c0_seq2:387-2462(-)
MELAKRSKDVLCKEFQKAVQDFVRHFPSPEVPVSKRNAYAMTICASVEYMLLHDIHPNTPLFHINTAEDHYNQLWNVIRLAATPDSISEVLELPLNCMQHRCQAWIRQNLNQIVACIGVWQSEIPQLQGMYKKDSVLTDGETLAVIHGFCLLLEPYDLVLTLGDLIQAPASPRTERSSSFRAAIPPPPASGLVEEDIQVPKAVTQIVKVKKKKKKHHKSDSQRHRSRSLKEASVDESEHTDDAVSVGGEGSLTSEEPFLPQVLASTKLSVQPPSTPSAPMTAAAAADTQVVVSTSDATPDLTTVDHCVSKDETSKVSKSKSKTAAQGSSLKVEETVKTPTTSLVSHPPLTKQDHPICEPETEAESAVQASSSTVATVPISATGKSSATDESSTSATMAPGDWMIQQLSIQPDEAASDEMVPGGVTTKDTSLGTGKVQATVKPSLTTTPAFDGGEWELMEDDMVVLDAARAAAHIVSPYDDGYLANATSKAMQPYLFNLDGHIGMEPQGFACWSCESAFDIRHLARTLFCHYTRKYYCSSCHHRHKAVIPARLFFNWDAGTYEVCDEAYAYLQDIYHSQQPKFDLLTVCPGLGKTISIISRYQSLRDYLHRSVAVMATCDTSPPSITDALRSHEHIARWPLGECFRDVSKLKNGKLIKAMEQAKHTIEAHTKHCDHCNLQFLKLAPTNSTEL